MRARSLLVAILTSIGPAFAQTGPPNPPPAPTLSFEADAVIAKGFPPGAKIVWFSVAREISQHTATIKRRDQIVEDTDKDSSVRFELDRSVPFQSIWVAADLATGQSAIGVPEGYPLRRVDMPASNVGHGGGKPDWVEDNRGYVDILVIRPGQGAWRTTVGDGGVADEDGAYDGKLQAPLDEMSAIGSSPSDPPEHFNPRDLIVVIDPNRMEVGSRQLVEVKP